MLAVLRRNISCTTAPLMAGKRGEGIKCICGDIWRGPIKQTKKKKRENDEFKTTERTGETKF